MAADQTEKTADRQDRQYTDDRVNEEKQKTKAPNPPPTGKIINLWQQVKSRPTTCEKHHRPANPADYLKGSHQRSQFTIYLLGGVLVVQCGLKRKMNLQLKQVAKMFSQATS